MKPRSGTWVVAIAACAMMVIHAVTLGVVDVRTVLVGEPAAPWPLVVLGYASDVALAIGALLLARRSRWFVVAAIAAAAPLADTVSPYANAGTAIAASAIVLGFDISSRRLSITTHVVAALYAAAVSVGWFAIVPRLALCVLTCFNAFSTLDAFPDATPVAQIANRTRSGVTAASYVFCMIGLALLALVLWQHRNVGAIDAGALIAGVGAFVGGAVALRRLHLVRSRIRNAVALVIAICVGAAVVFTNDRPRPDKVPLVEHEACGVRVSLPVGYVTAQTDTLLEVRPHHSKFGPVRLRRHRGAMPADKVVRFGYTGTVDDADTGVRVRWTCNPAVDWVELELVVHGVNTFNSPDHDIYLNRLVDRVNATFSCL